MSGNVGDIFSLRGKTALITGGSRGLGFDMAQAFLLAGAAKVYISSRKRQACEDAVKALNRYARDHCLTGEARSIPADVGQREGVEQLFGEFRQLEDRLDILVANAGATWGAPIETHPDSAFEKVLSLNVRGVFSTIQLFLPLLEAAGTPEDPARVLVTGSVAGFSVALVGNAYGYLASKAAVHHLARALAADLGPRNITVNVLAPGFFPTKMSNGVLTSIGDELTTRNPRQRLGMPEDIYGAVIYLCSRAGAYVNGVVLPVDGGAHLRL